VEREGWHDDVLLVVGHEVSPRGGHLLVFGAAGEIGHPNRDAAAISAAARAAARISSTLARPSEWVEWTWTTQESSCSAATSSGTSASAIDPGAQDPLCRCVRTGNQFPPVEGITAGSSGR
jgi:hypothetical protein